MNGFFSLLFVLLLDYFLIKVNKFGWPSSRHPPSITGVPSFVYRFSICPVVRHISVISHVLVNMSRQDLLLFIFFVYTTHTVPPVNPILFLAHTILLISTLKALYFFRVLHRRLFDLFDLCLKFLILEL